jgi:hypothetical protein
MRTGSGLRSVTMNHDISSATTATIADRSVAV